MTDDRLPPLGSDDRPTPPDRARRGASSRAGGAPPARRGADSAHPGLLELSAFLDRALTFDETAAISDHLYLDACAECAAELDRLSDARRLLLAAGRPSAPAGAMETAVSAALSSVGRSGRAPASAAPAARPVPADAVAAAGPVASADPIVQADPVVQADPAVPADPVVQADPVVPADLVAVADLSPPPAAAPTGTPSTIDLALSAALDAAASDLAFEQRFPRDAAAAGSQPPATGEAAVARGAAAGATENSRSAPDSDSGKAATQPESPTPSVAPPPPGPTRAPWMPAAWDADSSKQRAIQRHRRIRVSARAAAVVLVIGLLGGGVYAAIGTRGTSGSNSEAALKSAATTTQGVSHSGSTIPATTTTTRPPAGTIAAQPPAGAFSLQLRSITSSASCSDKTKLGVVFNNGTLELVNPPAGKIAVMQVPNSDSCIAVGQAFASPWSGNVTAVSVQAITGAGAPPSTSAVNLVLSLKAAAIDDRTTLADVLAGKATVAVIGQGTDYGTAAVTKHLVVTLTVSPLLATFIREQLLPSKGT